MAYAQRNPLTSAGTYRRPYDLPTSSNANAPSSRHQHQPSSSRPYSNPPQPPARDAPAPLPRQNSKTVPPSPPHIIRDIASTRTLTRVGFLGEGGFARVYEAADMQGNRYAIKVVTKSSLKTKKSKTKLYAEIKLHRDLEHPNIVRFQDCFEDNDNVYMTLELCDNGSMMDLLRRRKRFTEPEARFYMVQVIGACHYMHAKQIIHRDLKLGNLFLDASMNIKVGDFGLAALIETPGERKKTICGTPNYIAPEVLFDTANGHSYEVDTWSIGVILYTLVIGKPPFQTQTKDVKDIYQRIRDNNYEFPSQTSTSPHVQHLISQILTHDPQLRPTLHEIVDHAFFTHGIVPASIPKSAQDYPPSFNGLTHEMSQRNLARLKRQTLMDEDNLGVDQTFASSAAGASMGMAAGMSQIAQQEREFNKAVQPGSPISALLSSARQPLIVAARDPATLPQSGGGALLRKLQAAAPGGLVRNGSTSSLNGAGGPSATSTAIANQFSSIVVPLSASTSLRSSVAAGRPVPLATLMEQEEDEVAAKLEKSRTRELESQKARIVAQMAPSSNKDIDGVPLQPTKGDPPIVALRNEDRENVPPSASTRVRERERDLERERRKEKIGSGSAVPSRTGSANGLLQISSSGTLKVTRNPTSSSAALQRLDPNVKEREAPTSRDPKPASGTTSSGTKTHGFETVAETLSRAFDAKAEGEIIVDHEFDELDYPQVFIVSWVDYCNKYGMGYALTDGTIGVHFNDSTTLLLSPNKLSVDYISARKAGSVYVRKSHPIDTAPAELSSKLYLLKHFENYMLDRLYGEHPWCFDDVEKTKGMDFVQKYFRMKNVIVFKMSHDIIQFNFYDHTKLVLSARGNGVTYLDKHYKLTYHRLSDIMERSLNPDLLDEAERKTNEKLINKLNYCKEVLRSIRSVSASSAANAEEDGRR